MTAGAQLKTIGSHLTIRSYLFKKLLKSFQLYSVFNDTLKANTIFGSGQRMIGFFNAILPTIFFPFFMALKLILSEDIKRYYNNSHNNNNNMSTTTCQQQQQHVNNNMCEFDKQALSNR